MNIVDVYRLVYTEKDIPQHVLLQVQGLAHKALLAESTSNVKLAEWLLNTIEYESKKLLEYQTGMGSISIDKANTIGNRLKHIHRNCRQEIEGKFNKPVLNDEEVGEMLFGTMIEDYFSKDVTKLNLKTAPKADGALRISAEANARPNSAGGSLGERFGAEAADAGARALLKLLGEPW